MNDLTLDDRFYLLLHKKIMTKKGSARRRAKKYYKDQYKKTGIIPSPLLLVEKGIMEGRKASGRPRSIDEQTKKRFIDMVKASCDPSSRDFIFITRKARTIKNYHAFLEEELGRPISLPALRRCAKRENLAFYLEKDDFDDDVPVKHAFKQEAVFALAQMDGCRFRYLKIKDGDGSFQYPRVIELFDTGSRYMFTLEAYFSESNASAVDLFTRFLLSTPFPLQKIRIRPDNAKGFLNLKRVINALNLAYSTPDGFFMKADFARKASPKDKAHLESSHQGLHNFEIRIIKAFEYRIVRTAPAVVFHRGRKEKITVTLLDITLQELNDSPLIKGYCLEHNQTKHYFNENGEISAWVPSQKLNDFLADQPNTLSFAREQIREFMKYGFKKNKATVSPKKIIRHDKRDYYVTLGAEKFSRHKSTPVHISKVRDKLIIFEPKQDGILLGEALARKPFEQTKESDLTQIEPDELDRIILLLTEHNMVVDRPVLIEMYHKGITLSRATQVLQHNQPRYSAYLTKMNQPKVRSGAALFNAFILDCRKSLTSPHVVTYAAHGDLS
jgi:hypothetical protein